MSRDRTICIAGAGSIGCFVGGLLAAGGRDVSLLGRNRVLDDIRAHGLRLSSFEGVKLRVPPDAISMSDDPAAMANAGIIAVAVKSGDTAAMAQLIAHHTAADATIVSLQNGVENVACLKAALPGRQILGGMVPFNVVTREDGTVHRATSGALVIERDETDTAARFAVPHLAVRTTDDIAGVQWGKLLINLSNALNALSGLPLHAQLLQKPWRSLYADQISEGLSVLRAAGIVAVAPTAAPAWLTPYLLRLPDRLFAVVLDRVMKIDADARSSMWDDIQRGRPTEIDYLQGVLVRMAEQRDIAVPLCRRVLQLVKLAEADQRGSPGLSAEDVRGT